MPSLWILLSCVDALQLVDLAERTDSLRRHHVVVGCCEPQSVTQQDFCGVWAGNMSKYLFAPGTRYTIEPVRCPQVDCLGCTPHNCSTNYEKYDLIFCDGWNYATELKDAYRSSQKVQQEPPARKGITWSKGPRVHSRGRPFTTAFSGEAWDGGQCSFDMIFACGTVFDCPTVQAPVAMQTFAVRAFHTPESLVPPADKALESLTGEPLEKQRFAATMFADCWHPRYPCTNRQCVTVTARVVFARALAKYKPVDNLGKCDGKGNFPESYPWMMQKMGTHNFTFNMGEAGAYANRYSDGKVMPTLFDTKVYGFEEYRFVVSFDNVDLKGYLTEKLVDAKLARSVPIYWGDPGVETLLDPESFIYCKFSEHGFAELLIWYKRHMNAVSYKGAELLEKAAYILKPDIDECVEKVKRVDQDEELWHRMATRPLVPEIKGSIFDFETYASNLRAVLRAAQTYLPIRND